MRRLILALLAASAAAIASASVAAAADLPVKARPLPPPVWSWTGFYFGGNIGYGVGRDHTTLTTTSGPGILIVPVGTSLYGTPPVFNLARDGWNAGVQVGYNMQAAPNWVFGIEADIQGADMKDRVNCVIACGVGTAIAPGLLAALFPVNFSEISIEHKLQWFGTVRGRLGYAAGPALFYVTGGFAYGEIERSGRVAGSTSFVGIFPVNSFAGSFSTSSIKTGWTVGAGVEARLMDNWSVKAEYLYIDLGTVSDTFSTVAVAGIGAGAVVANRTYTSDITDHIFRIGLNYQLGGSVLAKY